MANIKKKTNEMLARKWRKRNSHTPLLGMEVNMEGDFSKH
jgi:hypothetical protein